MKQLSFMVQNTNLYPIWIAFKSDPKHGLIFLSIFHSLKVAYPENPIYIFDIRENHMVLDFYNAVSLENCVIPTKESTEEPPSYGISFSGDNYAEVNDGLIPTNSDGALSFELEVSIK